MNYPAAEICVLLSLLVRALVADRDAVCVTSYRAGEATVFQITVGTEDRGKLIGKQGRTAKSLRFLVNCIAKENGATYSLLFR